MTSEDALDVDCTKVARLSYRPAFRTRQGLSIEDNLRERKWAAARSTQ
jgi:hypothetical protein